MAADTLLTLTLLTWTIWRAPTNVSKWRMGYNSAFKGLNLLNQQHVRDVCIRISSYTKTLPHFTLNDVSSSVTGL